MAYDAVVVGAGPNGLVAANHLLDKGWSVLVLEAQPTVGGATRSCRARTVATASTAPAAPSRWPMTDFVLETGTRAACSPSAACSATVSERSLSGVDVPWALT